MPTYEFSCKDTLCISSGRKRDSLLRKWDDPNPNCPECAGTMQRHEPSPATIFAGSVGRFSSPDKEYYDPNGFWVTRTQSSRKVDGSPEKQYITTRQEQREYCRAEGLRMPDDVNTNAEVSKDGRTLITTGVKGQWVALPDLGVDNGKPHIEGWI